VREEKRSEKSPNGDPAGSGGGESGRRSAPAQRYWDIVRAQFRRNRVAVWALRGIVLVVGVAVFAPLLAQDRPYVLVINGRLEFPLFSGLLDRNAYDSGVDIFFNLILLALPLYALAVLLSRFCRTERRRTIRRWALGACGFLVTAAFVWLSFSPIRKPYRDFVEEIRRARERGESVWYLMPPVPYAYNRTNVAESTQPPSRRHFLGTDPQGRDVLSRLLYGTRISLTIGVVAVSIYTAIGIVIGSLAGFFGGWVDIVISRFIEVMICFPTFFLILTVIGLIEHRSIFHIMVVIGLTGWTRVARLIRGEVLRIRELPYVQAAITQGIRRRKIIFGHILPNAVAPVLVAATFGVAAAILIESGLAFLGLGDPTAPSWGELLTMGRTVKRDWLILSPGIAIFLVVLLFNLVGEGLRDALDPRLRA